jgi:glucose-6-phosphate 1-dehydrogenase
VPSTKLIVEKPFGHDLESARELDSALKASFTESQTFRIDHYLAKETVQNLLVLRFANGIFEPVWNRRYIDHVQLTVAEDLGIGHRVGYYDNSGALRDVVQNHMLQLLSLVAMEPPIYFNADEIRDEKVKALHAIKALDVSDVPEQVVKGQYQSGWIGGEPVPGYGDEDAVPDGSLTDTFVAMRLELDNWRWGGTPFYLRTGKRLPTKATEIAIVFRPVPHSPFQRIDLHQMVSNQLVISVQPNEGASLRMMAKVPGSTMDVRPVQMDFQYGASFLRESPEAYERVLHDALIGDATLFTRSDEVEAAWRTVDPILKEWESSLARPYPYAAGSTGPEAARTLIERDGRNWRPL